MNEIKPRSVKILSDMKVKIDFFKKDLRKLEKALEEERKCQREQ